MHKKGEEETKKKEPTVSVVPIFLGGGIALILLVLSAFVLAALIWGCALSPSNSGILLSICGGVSALIGGRIAIQKGSGSVFLTGVLSALFICVIMLIVCVGTRGAFEFNTQFLSTLLMILAGGALAGLLGRKKPKKKKRSDRK